jgi:hypothetical protein
LTSDIHGLNCVSTKQGEAGEVDLPLIDLGLGEVGIHREIGSQPRREVVEQIDAGVALVVSLRIAATGR